MASSLVHELIRGLENTIHERLAMIEEVVQRRQQPISVGGPVGPTGCEPPGWMQRAQDEKYTAMQRAHQFLLQRIDTLEEDVSRLRAQLAERCVPPPPMSLIPSQPLVGIEVIPKKEVIISEQTPEPINHADRLLMNTSARMALEEEEAGDEEEVEETDGGEETVVEEAEAEAEEEEEFEGQLDAADEEDGETLEEFEYKGATYYRDSDNIVYMTDADGAPYAVGVWSSVKARIIMKKPDE